MSKKVTAIIGGGASGVLAALELYRRLGSQITVLLFEPQSEVGRGLAYRKTGHAFMLNVSAHHLGVSIDKPDDFHDWLIEREKASPESPYWPYTERVHFGEYLQERLQELPSTFFHRIPERIESVREWEEGFQLTTASGENYIADAVLVATGYNVGAALPPPSIAHARWISATAMTKEVANHTAGKVLVIGTGLSAIDVFFALDDKPHLDITFISRRGLFPLRSLEHSDVLPSSVPAASRFSSLSPRQILQQLRILQDQETWQSLADQLRPQVPKIWKGWSLKERKAFLRHIEVYWNCIRHRVPSPLADRLWGNIKSMGARVLAAKIVKVEALSDAKIAVTYRPRFSSETFSEKFDFVFDARGSGIDASLKLGEECGKPSPMRLGYQAPQGSALYFIGPSNKEELWEITAIPEIRGQIHSVVKHLMQNGLGGGGRDH